MLRDPPPAVIADDGLWRPQTAAENPGAGGDVLAAGSRRLQHDPAHFRQRA